MTLRQHQSLFMKDTIMLMNYAYSLGYDLTYGEVNRDSRWQKMLIRLGLSWTMNSQHLKRLAIDLNLFIDGKYQSSSEAHYKLGKYWESLSPYNVWGGRFHDGNHYERRHDTTRRLLRKGKYRNDL